MNGDVHHAAAPAMSSVGGQAMDVIDAPAASQLGLVTRTQLIEAGVTRQAIAARVRRRRLWLVHRGVYRVGPLVVPRARELAAVLACGPDAALSHISAAALWKIVADPADSSPVDVTSRCDRGRRPGIRAHRVATLRPGEVTRVDTIPVTTPERTLLDLSSVLVRRDLEQAFAHAERERLVTRETSLGTLDRHRRCAGVVLLRALLAADTSALTRSEAEERFLSLIRKAGLPAPASNARVGSYEVDFLWRTERLVVEVDGFEFHSSPRQFESDRRRDAQLTADGLRVMRLTWRQIVNEREVVLVRVAQALIR